MTPSMRILPVDLVIPAEDANPQEVNRMISVSEQRAAGRTGGGPKCPWPECGERALAPLPNDDRFQCGGCHRGVQVKVTVEGLSVTPIYLERPKPGERQVDPPAIALYRFRDTTHDLHRDAEA